MSDFLLKKESWEENLQYFHEQFGIGTNFDMLHRVMEIGGRKCAIYAVDGFVKDDILEKLQEFFYSLKEEFPKDAYEFSKLAVPYIEINLQQEAQPIITAVLSGTVCILVEGYDRAVLIDCRTYPQRENGEPEKDKVLRGSMDGFCEILVNNTALIRRRIRSTQLRMEMMSAGKTSKTDIAICYMEDRVDSDLLKLVKERIQNITADALTMNQESLAECIYPRKWWNPFPKFKYTERPDSSSAAILRGKIIILVDNSPYAMILPTFFKDILEEANDHYFPPITARYLKFSRFLITIVSVFLTPVYLLFMQNPDWIPSWLQFIQIKDEVFVPLILQFLTLEIAIDGLKLAAINTPNMLSTPLSVIAALIIGEFATNSGWFNAEVMLYMAFVAIANFTQESYELGYAMKFMRILILILTALFNWVGFLVGVVILVLSLCTNKTIGGKRYIAIF